MRCGAPPNGSDIEMERMENTKEEERQRAVDLLFGEQCSCVVCNGGRMHLFRQRGVKDLYRLLKEEPELLRGAFVADKVVGKAAAALMILGGVEGVYAGVMSTPALALFRAARLEAACTREVPHIINRTQTGWCPLETRCFEMTTPEACLERIEEFLQTIG